MADDEEPTDPMLDDPPGARPKRPSLAPSLAMRISQVPSTKPGPLPAKFPVGWVFAGGLLIIMALGILIVSRSMSRTETVPVLSAPPPVPVPDPAPSAEVPRPEPVPDPSAEPEPPPIAETERPPTPPMAAEPTDDDGEEPMAVDESPPEQLAVIVHPGNPVNELSAEEIRRIYLEDRRFPDGRSAKPVGRYRAPALRRVFLELVLGTNHQAIKEYWEAKKAEGIERVRRLPSDAAVIELVSKRPDALGYVDWAKLSAEDQAKVKKVFEIRLQ